VPLPRPRLVKPSRPRRPKAGEWVLLESRIEALESDWLFGEVIGLPGWKTLRYKELEHDIIAMAELTTDRESVCGCPPHESELRGSGFTEPYYLHDVPTRGKRVRVYYRLRRWFCKRCKRSAQQSAPGRDADHKGMTSRLVEYVGRKSFGLFRTFSGVADEVGCSEQTVRNIFTTRAKRLEDEALEMREQGLYEPPEWLAIDEVFPQKRVEYCVISAPALSKVLDILPVNRERELAKWLLRLRPYRDRIKVVTMDMCVEYRRLVRYLLPDALIVVDRYHVHNLLNVALKGVLDVVRASMTNSERRERMRPEHLLLTSYRKLSTECETDGRGVRRPSPRALADRWLKEVPDVARAHRLKEEFSDILQLSDRGKAEGLTDEWLRRAHDFVQYFRGKYMESHPESWPDPFGNVLGTVSDWRGSILNYIDCKSMFNSRIVSNSFAEHVNDMIKKAYRVGHHYSYEVLRIKCVYGGVKVRRRPPHPLDRPRLRVVRGRRQAGKRDKKTNPDANLEVLKRARAEADDTRGLLPRPEEHGGWGERFNKEDIEKVLRTAEEPEPAAQIEMAFPDEEEQRPLTVECERRRRGKYNPDQLKMF
jgi:transposase